MRSGSGRRGRGRGGARGGRQRRGGGRGAPEQLGGSKAGRDKTGDALDGDVWPFLNSDLCMERGRAPAALPAPRPESAAPYKINGPLRLQVVSTLNLSSPRVGRVDLSDDVATLTSASPSRRLLQIQLTDGYREITCLEMKHVKEFDADSARVPGTKVLLVGSLGVCGGFLLLRPQNVRVLGGSVHHLARKHKLAAHRHDPFKAFHASSGRHSVQDKGNTARESGNSTSRRDVMMPPPFEEYDPVAESAAQEREERAMREARIETAKRQAALRGSDPESLKQVGSGADTKAVPFAQRHRQRKDKEAIAQKKGVFGVKEVLGLRLRGVANGRPKRGDSRTKVMVVEDMEEEEKGGAMESNEDGAPASPRQFGMRGIAASLDLDASGKTPQLVFAIRDLNDIAAEVRLPVSSKLLLVLLGLANAKGAPPLEKLWATSKGEKFVRKRVEKLGAALVTGAPATFRVEETRVAPGTTRSADPPWQIVNIE
eukprot:g1727.t1